MQIKILSGTVEPDEKMPLLLMKRFSDENGKTWGINGWLKISHSAPSKEEDIFATLNIFIQITGGSRIKKKFIKNYRLVLFKKKLQNANIINEVIELLQNNIFILFEEVSDYIGYGHSHGNFEMAGICIHSSRILMEIILVVCQMKGSPYRYENFLEPLFLATFTCSTFQQKKILQELSTQSLFNIIKHSTKVHLIITLDYISIYYISLYKDNIAAFILSSENPKMKGKYMMKLNHGILYGREHSRSDYEGSCVDERMLDTMIKYIKSNVIKQAQRFNLENPPYRHRVIFEYN